MFKEHRYRGALFFHHVREFAFLFEIVRLYSTFLLLIIVCLCSFSSNTEANYSIQRPIHFNNADCWSEPAFRAHDRKVWTSYFSDISNNVLKSFVAFVLAFSEYATTANIIAIRISDCVCALFAVFNCCAHEKPINYSRTRVFIHSQYENRNLHLIPYFNMFHIGMYDFRYFSFVDQPAREKNEYL